VTSEALVPFRTRAFARPVGDPEPLAYLASPQDAETGGIVIAMNGPVDPAGRPAGSFLRVDDPLQFSA